MLLLLSPVTWKRGVLRCVALRGATLAASHSFYLQARQQFYLWKLSKFQTLSVRFHTQMHHQAFLFLCVCVRVCDCDLNGNRTGGASFGACAAAFLHAAPSQVSGTGFRLNGSLGGALPVRRVRNAAPRWCASSTFRRESSRCSWLTPSRSTFRAPLQSVHFWTVTYLILIPLNERILKD